MKLNLHSNNCSQLVQATTQRLTTHYPKDVANQYAWWLVQAATNRSRIDIIAHPDIEPTTDQIATIENWLNDHLINHKPLQYILGEVPFADSTIIVEPPTLIPRPETEEMVLNLIVQLKQCGDDPLMLLDMCTGSGCIAIALAHALPHAQVYAVDLQTTAIELARKNCTHNKVDNITVIQSDLFTNLPKDIRFDMIICNPPYIAHHEWQQLDPSVKNWEDPHALVAADNGFAILKNVITQAPRYIRDNKVMKHIGAPQLVLEIGHEQGDVAQQLLHDAGYNRVALLHDYAGNQRVVSGRVDDMESTPHHQ